MSNETRIRPSLGSLALMACVLLCVTGHARAQYSDMDLKLRAAGTDSLVANYDNIFPIWGRKAVEKGVRLQKPVGVNLNYFGGTQGIAISNLALAINEGDWIDTSEIFGFEETISDVENVNARFDLWVLPFFNVYGMLGYSWGTTSVKVSQPVAFTSSAELQGPLYGTGFTAAGGLQGFWFALDTNWTWSDLDLLADPVRTRIFGLRAGKNYRWQDKSVAAWVGAMKLTLANETEGTVALSEVLPEIPPELGDRFQDWYDGLTPPQQAVVDYIQANRDSDTEIHYSLHKAPTSQWSMALGGQIEFSPAWQFRAEANFLGDRRSILANLVYRFDL